MKHTVSTKYNVDIDILCENYKVDLWPKFYSIGPVLFGAISLHMKFSAEIKIGTSGRANLFMLLKDNIHIARVTDILTDRLITPFLNIGKKENQKKKKKSDWNDFRS